MNAMQQEEVEEPVKKRIKTELEKLITSTEMEMAEPSPSEMGSSSASEMASEMAPSPSEMTASPSSASIGEVALMKIIERQVCRYSADNNKKLKVFCNKPNILDSNITPKIISKYNNSHPDLAVLKGDLFVLNEDKGNGLLAVTDSSNLEDYLQEGMESLGLVVEAKTDDKNSLLIAQ